MTNTKNPKIKACVALSVNYQVQFIKSRPLSDDLFSIRELFTGLDWSFEWLKACLLPLVLVMMLIMLLIVLAVTPFSMAVGGFKNLKQLKAVRKNLQVEDFSDCDTLYDLWFYYGVDKYHPEEERVKLLTQWLEILYPESIYQTIDIHDLIDETIASNARTRQNLREKVGVTCVLFKDPLDCVVMDISKDYPLIF